MKYKLGQEIFIKAQIADIDNMSEEYFVTLNPHSINWVSEDKIIPIGKTYSEGLSDAWELAKKIYDMTCKQVEKIFGVDGGFWNVVREITVEEALAKIEAYEKEKEIKVGDVVHIFPVAGGEYSAVVVRRNDGNADVLYNDGLTANAVPLKLVKKTGKHIDIESLLKEIGE